MEKEQIRKLINRKIDFNDMAKAKMILNKNYIIKSSKMESADIKITLQKGSPVAINNHIIIGYDPLRKAFIDSNEDLLQIQRPIEAITIERELPDNRQLFAIVGRIEWANDLRDFNNVIGSLKLGEVFLPKHSAIFNFLNHTEETRTEKIQSVLDGIKINVYDPDNYVDNCLHEIGHLFWRTCLTYDERIQFEELFKYIKPSALYEYPWERSDAQEVFCTIYKWYLKSILLNNSFLNILSHEEPHGYMLLQNVFERIAKSRLIDDIWELSKSDVSDYLFPKVDRATGIAFRKKGSLDAIKDIDLPESILNDIESVQNGTTYINFGKAVLPVNGRLIDYEKSFKKLEKASGNIDKPIIYLDMDGVVADIKKGYYNAFDKDIDDDDTFTVFQQLSTIPYFFRTLPVIEQGRELYNRLIKKYQVIFLTTPAKQNPTCKADKVQWLKENFGEGLTVLFSENKADFAQSSFDFLIDDMDKNLIPFADAGGTAIDFRKYSNDDIMSMIAETINPQEEIRQIKEQIKKMQVETEPTEKQKETGNYKKGKVIIKGMTVMIENPKGSIRFGISEDHKKWMNKMTCHYGYFLHKGEGNDGDKVDCFIGDNFGNNKAYVINQGKQGFFDEVKVMMGFQDIESAKNGYLSCYSKGQEKNIISIIPTNTKKLREYLENGNFKEPFK